LRILVIEDEDKLLKVIAKRLKEEGYAIDMARNGKEGQALAESVKHDCIILDLILPGLDGLNLLHNLRLKNITIPVLILTAKDSTDDKIKGLDLGADDYLTKPFSFGELSARVRALIRRKSSRKETDLTVGDLQLNLLDHTARRGKKNIELTNKEYSILEYLMRNRGRVLTKSQIAEHVWNLDFEYNTNIIEVYIRFLRRKIDDGYQDKLIHTLRGSGYILKDKHEKTEN
jgi:DNA-binding response OmpR family regulator